MSSEHSEEEESKIDFINLTSEIDVEQNCQDIELDIELLISFIENKPVL